MSTKEFADKTARFDWIYSSANETAGEWNEDLSPKSLYATLTTLGAIVPNWLLLIPRTKRLNFSSLSVESRKEAIQQALKTASVSKQKSSESQFIFEHGADSHGSSTGCGVDQAHLHVLSANLEISDLMDSKMNWRQVNKDDPWSSVTGEYLLVSNFDISFVCDVEYPISQYFRKKIALAVGKSDQWDYKSNPLKDIAMATSQRLKHALRSG